MSVQVNRLLSRGQRALQSHQFQFAIECLEQAVRAEPSHPHLHMYLGMAQAGFGRFDKAQSELSTALTLAPDNFVFHLQLGILQLDARDPDRALSHLQVANSLSAGNSLVAGYLALASFDLGQSSPLSLGEHITTPNPSFRARAILRIEQERQRHGSPRDCLRALLAPHELIPATGSVVDRFTTLGSDRQVRRLSHLILECRFEDAIQFVSDRPHLLARTACQALLGLAREMAIASLGRVVSGLDSTAGLSETTKEDRRSVLARLAQIQMDSNDNVGAYETLEAWRDTLGASDTSSRRKSELAKVLVAMAHVEVERGRYREAGDLCAQARQGGARPEVDAVDAIACQGVGDSLTARLRLESFLEARLFPMKAYIQTLGLSSR